MPRDSSSATSFPRDVATRMVRDLERKMRETPAIGSSSRKPRRCATRLIELRRQIGGNESLLFGGKAPKIFDKALAELELPAEGAKAGT